MLRVLLVDDHQIVRDSIKRLLADNFGAIAFGEASDGKAALTLFDKEPWDLVLLDMTLPQRNGLEVLQEMRTRNPKAPVLILSALSEDEVGLRVVKTGAAGFVSKETNPEEIVRAVHKAISGRRYISSRLAEKMAVKFGTDYEGKPHEQLSDREYTVLKMIGSGASVTEIGKTLCISVKTVSTYRARILEKMQLRGNAEMIRYAIRNGIVE
jgi:DNA-binding NarL/FixJ family response regulator